MLLISILLSLSETDMKSLSLHPKHYFSNLVSSSSDNPKRLWQSVNKVQQLLRRKFSPLPSFTASISAADST